MKKYEYKSVDLKSTMSISPDKKTEELVKKLNEMGNDGWILISGIRLTKPFVFIREIIE